MYSRYTSQCKNWSRIQLAETAQLHLARQVVPEEIFRVGGHTVLHVVSVRLAQAPVLVRAIQQHAAVVDICESALGMCILPAVPICHAN